MCTFKFINFTADIRKFCTKPTLVKSIEITEDRIPVKRKQDFDDAEEKST